VCGIAWKVEPSQWRVAGASITSENQPCLFLLRPSVEEFELRIRDPTIDGVYGGWLRAVALTDDLDEALAGVDLVAENLALGAEDFLDDGRVPQPRQDCGDATSHLPELRRNAGNKDGRLIHGVLAQGFRPKWTQVGAATGT
jgi:hypothetical protein